MFQNHANDTWASFCSKLNYSYLSWGISKDENEMDRLRLWFQHTYTHAGTHEGLTVPYPPHTAHCLLTIKHNCACVVLNLVRCFCCVFAGLLREAG
jgi:hypothetical protein